MQRATTLASVLLLLYQHCTALLAPHVATRTHLRAVRIEGLLDEEVISKRTNTHRCLKELRKRGAVADALAADACVKSQFGDPLATGAEDAIKINNVLAQAITETDAPDYNGENATQSWRLKRGPLRLEGLTRVSFDSDGRASIIELGVSNVNGLEVDATSAQARQALVGFLGGASSERYNAVADFGQRALASTLSLVSTASTTDEEDSSSEGPCGNQPVRFVASMACPHRRRGGAELVKARRRGLRRLRDNRRRGARRPGVARISVGPRRR